MQITAVNNFQSILLRQCSYDVTITLKTIQKRSAVPTAQSVR